MQAAIVSIKAAIIITRKALKSIFPDLPIFITKIKRLLCYFIFLKQPLVKIKQPFVRTKQRFIFLKQPLMGT
ncbi:MAG: hypothetical protein LBL74_03170 [Bacteroidales bacterium]|nr:hypothetical protein [Bacteroidales bacterium]